MKSRQTVEISAHCGMVAVSVATVVLADRTVPLLTKLPGRVSPLLDCD